MFHRIAVTPVLFAVAVALMACGNSASESTPTSTESPEARARPAAPTSAAASPPESAQCLDLVAKSMFEEAVPVCARAVGLDPENTDVKQALETARTKAAADALGNSSAIPSAGKDAAARAAGGKLP